MTDERLLQKQVEDGQLAEAILENPIFKQIAQDVEKEFSKAFKGEDDDVAAEARRQIRTFETILTKLTYIHQRGMLAHRSLEELRQRRSYGLPTDSNSIMGIV